jgi:putative transposase
VVSRTSQVSHKPSKRTPPTQASLPLPKARTWGGARKGAGRKPSGARAGVSHASRPALPSRYPVHVTLRLMPHVWNLRSKRGFRVVSRALTAASARFGMRISEYAVLGNHVHLVVEARDRVALSRGMQGFGIRLAQGLNRLMHQQGRVLCDRYHARALRTLLEVKRAVLYVRRNYVKHARAWNAQLPADYVDPYSSASAPLGLAQPRTWLLSTVALALAQHRT